MIDRTLFLATLSGQSIYPHLKKSLLPFAPDDVPPARRPFLESLIEEIRSGQYFPSVPRGYIVENKHNRVARIIPVLTFRDACVYYFCVKQLEQELATGTVPGTYGGWTLGNPMRTRELREQEQARQQYATQSQGEYIISGSFDPARWSKHW